MKNKSRFQKSINEKTAFVDGYSGKLAENGY